MLLTLTLAVSVSVSVNALERGTSEIKIIAYGKVMNLSDKGVKRGNTVYVPVREVCEALGANVRWDPGNKLAVVISDSKVYVPDIVIIKNKAFAKAAVLEEIFGCSVETMYNINVVAINVKGKSLSVGDLVKILPLYGDYSNDDLEWLAKIVHAEAKGEDYESKLAVANVILNRVHSPLYPNTIKGVIFDKKSGVQFTPTVNGSIYNTPSADSFLAAMEALEGNNNAQYALFFINPKIAKSSWVSQNREFAFALGNHNFYY